MVVMMEPRLARRLQALGIPFVPVGEPTDYHGVRAAYHLTVQECRQSWMDIMRQMYDFIYEDFQARAIAQSLPFD